MDRRKVLTYLLGASFIAGLTSNSIRKKRGTAPPNKKSPLSSFVGTWSFAVPFHHGSRRLIIDEEGRLFVDEKHLSGTLNSVSHLKFIFTDHYGYELIFHLQENNQLHLYDSADEKEYLLVPYIPEEPQVE